MAGEMIIYALAVFNDFPDLLAPFVHLVSVGTTLPFDLVLDGAVLIALRYLMQPYIAQVPGLSYLLYSTGVLEAIPIVGWIPWWTICAVIGGQMYKAKIGEQEEAQAGQRQSSKSSEQQENRLAGQAGTY
jgi:hypothetical protein